MKKSLVFLILIVTLLPALYGVDPTEITVAIVYAQDEMGKFQSDVESGMLDQARAASVQLKIHDLFLGLPAEFSDDRQKIIDYLQIQLDRIQADVIVVMLSAAIQFVSDAIDELDGDFGVIYAIAPSGFHMPGESSIPQSIVYSATPKASEETIQLMSKLFPHRDQLTVIGGTHPSDTPYIEMVLQKLQLSGTFRDVNFAIGLTPGETEAFLSHLSRRDIVLISSYSTDRNNTPHVLADILGEWSELSKAPIFGFYESIADTGIVGGYVTTIEGYSSEIFQQIMELFPGEIANGDAGDIGPRLMLNAEELRRWGVPGKRIPAGAMIMRKNTLPGFLIPAILILLILITAAGAVMTAGFIRSKKRRMKIERELDAARLYIRESNHRVKNSFQLINSYIRIKYISNSDRKHGELFQELIAQIGIFGKFHADMTRSGLDTPESCVSFLRTFGTDIDSYGRSVLPELNLNFDLEDVSINSSQTLNLAFILSELFTNSLKYAFSETEGKKPRISISIGHQDDKRITVRYSDNGIGVDTFVDNDSEGLGKTIIRGLLEQLNGIIQELPAEGYLVEFSFPETTA